MEDAGYCWWVVAAVRGGRMGYSRCLSLFWALTAAAALVPSFAGPSGHMQRGKPSQQQQQPSPDPASRLRAQGSTQHSPQGPAAAEGCGRQ